MQEDALKGYLSFGQRCFFLDLKLFCITFGKRLKRQVRERKALDVIRLGNLCFGEGWGPKVPMSLSHLAAFSFLDTSSLNLVSTSSAGAQQGLSSPARSSSTRPPNTTSPAQQPGAGGSRAAPPGQVQPGFNLCSASTAAFCLLFPRSLQFLVVLSSQQRRAGRGEPLLQNIL